MTWRMVGVLIDHLPMESATKTAVRDATPPGELAAAAKRANGQPGWGPMSPTDFRLLALADRLDEVAVAIYRAAGAKPRDPEPYPRPGLMPKHITAIESLDPVAVDFFERRREIHRRRQEKARQQAAQQDTQLDSAGG